MTTYKGIRGLTIRTVAGDPSPLIAGDIWYSSTAKKIRGAKLGAGAWASGGNTNTGIDAGGYLGIQTAAMYFGGRGGSPITTAVDTSETYDGSSWTETADLPTAIYQNAGFGTVTAGVSRGGMNASNAATTPSHEWYGTSWTTGNAGQNANRNIHGTGT